MRLSELRLTAFPGDEKGGREKAGGGGQGEAGEKGASPRRALLKRIALRKMFGIGAEKGRPCLHLYGGKARWGASEQGKRGLASKKQASS